MPDDDVFKGDTELADYAKNKGWTPDKFPEVVKGYREVEKLQGSMVKIPGKDATDEDWVKFNARMAPKDDYNVEVPGDLPEGVYDEKFAGVMKAIAKEAGIHERSFNKLWSSYWEHMSGMNKTLDDKTNEIKAQDEKTLRDFWKSDYDVNFALSTKALDHYKVTDILTTLGLDGHPGLREMARFCAEHMKEDKTRGGESVEEGAEWYTDYKGIG